MNTIEISPKQSEYILNANSRWNIKMGATQSGKTYLDTRYLIPQRLLERKGKEGLNFIVGVTKETIERNVKFEINNVSSDVEIFNTTAFTVTDYLIFKKNKENIVYSAILDNKTCLVCGSYDGKEFELKDVPIPPLHQNCRCILVPVSIADNELPTFTEWFEEQTEDSKYQIPYTNACIRAFGRRFDMPTKEAFLYLKKYKGIDFLVEFYEIEHLQSIEDAVDDLILYCKKNGGHLS